ncbi:sulfatase [Paenibacillus ginsengarvi]|uniref:DUF229 domain-containing protein n=1 Tax=Paenibacillus ginsengarvi TaxID=400777 RepID=A0A3B0CNJ5_9BACL|nr:sulfatase [Paenibacillus ginsengarvi]RKN85486.1 DUF229 domain-containing protein [Paenibacillus ginsengarvi]
MKQKQPNLLFVFPDQWRKQAVGLFQEDPVLTPNIDRFAADSVTLTHAISCFPLCSPNRSCMLTGCYPLTTGVTTNCKTGLPIKLNDDAVTIGNVLKEEGYSTGYIGKWHLDLPELNTVSAPQSGARNWDAYIPPGPRRFGFDFWHAYNANDRHMSPHYWEITPDKITPAVWSTEHETDVAIDFIRSRDRDRPFALFVSWNPPHQPFEQVPDCYKEMYKDADITYRPNVTGDGVAACDKHLRNYFAAVTGTDDQFGRLLRHLEDEGLVDDTIVVLTSDHGELMGAHGYNDHKNIWYEEAIAVPFFLRWPGQVAARQEDMLFNSVDIVPTLLGLMDIARPDTIQGTDYSAIFQGLEGQRPTSAFICQYPGSIREHEEAERLGVPIAAFGYRGIRTQRYTYVVRRSFGAPTAERWLYDNIADPYQLAPEQLGDSPASGEAARLEQELAGWLSRIGDPFILK